MEGREGGQRQRVAEIAYGGSSAIGLERNDAGVVELVDTRDLKSRGRKSVPVRVRSPAPI